MVPDWPSSVVFGTFDGRYVALYVCANALEARAKDTREAKRNMMKRGIIAKEGRREEKGEVGGPDR